MQMLDAGVMPHYLALTTAAYLSCIAPLHGFDPGIHAREMQDPARQSLENLAAGSATGAELAGKVIGQLHLLGDELANRHEFIHRTGELIDIIHQQGPLAAARAAADSTALLTAQTRSIQ
jgi:fructuronate reductase